MILLTGNDPSNKLLKLWSLCITTNTMDNPLSWWCHYLWWLDDNEYKLFLMSHILCCMHYCWDFSRGIVTWPLIFINFLIVFIMGVYLSSADWSSYLLPVLKRRCEDLRELNASVFPCREYKNQFVITGVNMPVVLSCGCSVCSDFSFIFFLFIKFNTDAITRSWQTINSALTFILNVSQFLQRTVKSCT